MNIRYTTVAALALLAASALAVPSVEAADFSGQITALRYNAGATPARISIEVGPHSSLCSGNPDWFAFERADRGLQRLWHEALLEAWTNNQPVFIKSNGRCDTFGVEGVEYIEVRR
jgi:hypothetical protein